MISGQARVLVVDDDPVSLGFLAAVLEQSGCSVVRCADAGTALAAAEPFDLLVLDRNLPDSDGITLLQRLRARGIDAPAVATSAEIDIHDRDRLLDAGFAATLHKPAGVAAIQALVGTLIGLPAAAEAVPSPPAPRRVTIPSLLDDDAALVAIGGDRAALGALRGLLRNELKAVIDALQSPHAEIDGVAFTRQLHRLRASCGFCGAALLGAAAADLESRMRAPHEDVRLLAAGFLRTCTATHAALGGA